MRIIRWFVVGLLTSVLIACAHRSVYREVRRDDHGQVRPGDRVRLVLKGGETLKGKVVESTLEAITIRVTAHKGEKQVTIHTYWWEEIATLEIEAISGSERWHGVRNGIVAVGAVVGLGFFLLSLATD